MPRHKKSRHRTSAAKTPNARQLRVEQLEDRRLLAVLTVQNNLDDTLANLAGDGELSLREAIEIANNPGTVIDGFVSNDVADEIVFNEGLPVNAISLNDRDLEITESLSIDASTLAVPITIDARNRSRVLHFSAMSGDLSLKNLIITGGYSFAFNSFSERRGNGAGIRFESKGTLHLNSSKVTGNFVDGENTDGGGIFTYSGNVVLTNSSVSNNNSENSASGVFTVSGDVSLNNSEVRENLRGGIGSISGSITLTASAVNDNDGVTHGISTGSGAVVLNKSVISGNYLGVQTGSGSIYAESTVITGNYGGGIRTREGAVRLIECVISANRNNNGGGIYSRDGNITVFHSTISGNAGRGNRGFGGGISSRNGLVSVTDSIITENESTHGAGIYATFGEIRIQNSRLTGNVGLAGAAVFSANGNLSVVDSQVILNNTRSRSSGGSIIATHSANISLVGTTVHENNRAVALRGLRSVIHSETGSVSLTNSTVVDNISSGIYTANDITLTKSAVSGNSGYGVKSVSGEIQVTDSTITNHNAHGIISYIGDVDVIDSTIRNNRWNTDPRTTEAPGDGGGIYAKSGNVTLSGSTISGNIATGQSGGGIYAGEGNVSLTSSRVSGNISGSGGGIFADEGRVTLADSIVEDNQASYFGGGIFANNGDVIANSSSITGNSSSYNGGGIYARGGDVTIVDSAVKGNLAQKSGDYTAFGGGVFAPFGNVTVTNSTISGNLSSGNGGGIASSFGDVTLNASTVSENQTNAKGGGILTYSADVTLIKSTVSNNRVTYTGAFSRGGGIYTAYDAAISLTKSTISGNSSGHSGGGIFTGSGGVTINDSTVTGNSAVVEGGGVFAGYTSRQSVLLIENSIVAGNQSPTRRDLNLPLDRNFTVTYSLIGDITGTGLDPSRPNGNLLNVDPLLGPLADNGGTTRTHALLPGSPAIDAGDPLFEFDPNAYDQRGAQFLRIADGNLPDDIAIDMGAYEAQSVASADFDADGDVDGTDFLTWQRGFGMENAVRADGNSDDDSDVDASDLAAWTLTYGQGSVASGQQAEGGEELNAAAWAWALLGESADFDESPILEQQIITANPFAPYGNVRLLAPVANRNAYPEMDASEKDRSDSKAWLSDELLDGVFG